MKRQLFELIKCPHCMANFEIKEIYKENGEEIINGYIKCECGDYPILYGILILKNTSTKDLILRHLKKKEIEKAISLSFSKVSDLVDRRVPGGKFVKKNLLGIVDNFSNYNFPNDKLSFCDALDEVLPNRRFALYLKHRFSSQTFWLLYPFIKLLRGKRKRILDVCCGTGHASFILSEYINPEELICIDENFIFLYLAKKYFSPNAEFINVDVNCRLPFKDDIFSAILMMDGFHYVNARRFLAKELERIVDQNGSFLLLHLHNSLVGNVVAGKPLTPSEWKSLFEVDLIVLPENSIIENFILKDRLDLSKNYSEEELKMTNAISMIYGVDLNCFEGIWKDIINIKKNLIINPIYKMEEKQDIILTREFPGEFYRKEYPLTEEYLPDSCTIDKMFTNGRRIHVSDKIEELMRRFVIINVPEKYIN